MKVFASSVRNWERGAVLSRRKPQSLRLSKYLVLGASLRWQGVADNKKLLSWMLLFRQGLIPAIMFTIAILLGFTHEELGVIIILFGAPCAVSCFPMADAMGGDGQLAARQVGLTTVISMGTLFVLIYVGKLLAIL